MEVLSNFQAELLRGNPLTVATAILVILIVWHYVKKVSGLEEDQHIDLQIVNPPKGKAPPMMSGIPIFGNAIQFGDDPVTLMRNGFKKFGECFSLSMFGETMTLLCSPEGHEFFFKAKEDEFSACKAYQFTVPIFGPGVVYDSPPETLIEQRMFAGGALSIRRFKLYVPMIEKECEDYFANAWGEEGEAELMQAFNEITVLTSTRCLQGREIRETLSVEFTKLYWDLDKSLTAFGFFFPNVPLPSFIDRNRARKRIGEIFQNVITNRRNNPGEVHEDLVQTLMDAKYKDGTSLPDEHIVGLMVGILLAGQHTSNVTGAWLGVHLLQNPDVYQKCVEEQKRLVGDGDLTFEQLKDSTYLYQVMRETLRLNPPIIMMMRRVMKDIEFKGYTLRKGTFVTASPSLSHRLDTFYTNPDKFDPERFSPERAEDKKYSFSYIAFGGGKHACIGESFAFVQVRAIWSWLLRNYDIELVSKNVVPNYKTMVVAPQPPITVRYKRIKRN